MCFNSANSSADLNHNHTTNAIIIIGKINIRLYIIKYIYPREFKFALSDARYHNIVKYGPDVHGSKNKLTINHTTNAHIGDTALSITFFIAGLQDNGTSITNPFLYRKKSFKFANHTTIHNIQTICFNTVVFVADANALNSHNHIAK